MLSKLLSQLFFATSASLYVLGLGVNSALAEDLVFTLKNQSSSSLVEFYVESSNLDNWGENILTQDVAPGGSGQVTIADGKRTCTYDIKGVFADHSKLEDHHLNLCELGSYTYKD